MSDYMKYGTGRFENIAALSIDSVKIPYIHKDEIKKVSERFLRSAVLIPENEILGWQISASENDPTAGYFFSSSGVRLTKEDYCWVFKGCGTVGKMNSSEIRNLFAEGRKVYVLSSVPGSSKDAHETKKKERHSCCDKDGDTAADTATSGKDFSELFHMLMTEDAVIHIIAGPSDENAFGHGVFLISLPREMSLRMRAVISLAFPHGTAEELKEASHVKKKVNLIHDKLFLKGMSMFLIALLYRIADGVPEKREALNEDPLSEKPETLDKDTVSEESETPDKSSDEDTLSKEAGKKAGPSFIYIEDLDLSVRSYNCLKRAGIQTVEELQMMSDEDLMHVRNLGRKCLEEIKQKIEEIKTSNTSEPSITESHIDMLNELIGLEDVKKQIKKFAAYAKMKKDMALSGNDRPGVVMNMEFVGNPGTAKTSVARIVAGIFHEIGLLPHNDPVEVGRADLVAEYEGQTAAKIKRVFQRARGRVLFIDEAYSLTEQPEGSFGDEAINTIVQEMENKREDTVVIFTGYPKEMNDFFAGNPGLRSRVPFRIVFNDYSAEELLQIIRLEAEKRGFSIQAEAESKLMSVCQRAAGNAKAGNGRFCRNIVENAIIGYASRVYDAKNVNAENDFKLIASDFTTDSMIEERRKNPIGFSSIVSVNPFCSQ